jgi:hypothetical protein
MLTVLGQDVEAAVLDPEPEGMYELGRAMAEVRMLNFGGEICGLKAWVHTDEGQLTLLDTVLPETIKVGIDEPFMVPAQDEVNYGCYEEA